MDYCNISKPGHREVNEDCVGTFISDNLSGFVVADGLGGHGKGDVASKIAVNTFINTLEDNTLSSASQRLDVAINISQQAILLEQAHTHSSLQMKTAFAAIIIEGKMAICGHIGDTRIYVFRHNKIWRHTLDHSVPQMLVFSKEIKKKNIRNHPDRNKVSVNSSNAVDKREQPPRKDGCSLFSCKRKVTAKKDGEKTPREANPHWAP